MFFSKYRTETMSGRSFKFIPVEVFCVLHIVLSKPVVDRQVYNKNPNRAIGPELKFLPTV